MRAPAKRYLATVPGMTTPETERECVDELILEHRRSTYSLRRLSWFGRLLWKLFGRWL